MDSMRLLAYVQCLMFAAEGEIKNDLGEAYNRLYRIENYLIRRVNRGVFN